MAPSVSHIDLDAIPETDQDEMIRDILGELNKLPQQDQGEIWEIMGEMFEPEEMEAFRRMKI